MNTLNSMIFFIIIKFKFFICLSRITRNMSIYSKPLSFYLILYDHPNKPFKYLQVKWPHAKQCHDLGTSSGRNSLSFIAHNVFFNNPNKPQAKKRRRNFWKPPTWNLPRINIPSATALLYSKVLNNWWGKDFAVTTPEISIHLAEFILVDRPLAQISELR